MNLATTSVYLLSPAPTKTVVRAPRLIARASTKSGTGVGERAARRSVQGLHAPREGDGSRGRGLLPLSFAAFLFPSCEGAKWHSKEWIVNFVVVIAAAPPHSFPLPLCLSSPYSLGQIRLDGKTCCVNPGSVDNVFTPLFIRRLNLRHRVPHLRDLLLAQTDDENDENVGRDLCA